MLNKKQPILRGQAERESGLICQEAMRETVRQKEALLEAKKKPKISREELMQN